MFYDYSEDMRPEKPFEFDDILAISAIQGGQEIELVKNRIRELLDVHNQFETEQSIEENAKLINKIKENIKEHRPRLV